MFVVEVPGEIAVGGSSVFVVLAEGTGGTGDVLAFRCTGVDVSAELSAKGADAIEGSGDDVSAADALRCTTASVVVAELVVDVVLASDRFADRSAVEDSTFA